VGHRSEALRSLLRDGLRTRESQAELLVAVQQGVALDANEVEDAFGAKLDQMLGGLG
jgi:hypothetical protein